MPIDKYTSSYVYNYYFYMVYFDMMIYHDATMTYMYVKKSNSEFSNIF